MSSAAAASASASQGACQGGGGAVASAFGASGMATAEANSSYYDIVLVVKSKTSVSVNEDATSAHFSMCSNCKCCWDFLVSRGSVIKPF